MPQLGLVPWQQNGLLGPPGQLEKVKKEALLRISIPWGDVVAGLVSNQIHTELFLLWFFDL